MTVPVMFREFSSEARNTYAPAWSDGSGDSMQRGDLGQELVPVRWPLSVVDVVDPPLPALVVEPQACKEPEVRDGPAGRDGVDAYGRRELVCELAHQPEARVLARDVQRPTTIRQEGRVREGEDHAATGRDDLGQRRLRAEQKPLHVHREHLVEGFLDDVRREVLELDEGVADAGVPDEDVELSQAGDGFLDGADVVGQAAHVSSYDVHGVPLRLVRLERLRGDVHDGHRCALADEPGHDCASDAGGAPCDKSDLSLEPPSHHNTMLRLWDCSSVWSK